MRTIIAVFLLVCFCCVPAWAQIAESDPPSVLDYFDAPALELGVAKELTLAIAGVESGLSPWVLNIEGQPFRFDSKEKALEKAREAWSARKSFDVGLMQVNSQWLRRFGISPEAALDPLANVYFGTWILKQEINRNSDIRSAIGAYHSPTPARASHYADQVMAALKRGPQPAKRPAAKTQDVLENELPRQPKKHYMLVSAAPADSGMLVLSPKAGLAVPDSMKVSATRSEGSMKIKGQNLQ